MNKFTPGPWKSGRKHPFSEVRYVDFTDMHGTTDEICTLYYSKGEEQEANARLIAAAPEMYEALELLTEHWDKDQSYEATVLNAKDIIANIKQIISKVKER